MFTTNGENESKLLAHSAHRETELRRFNKVGKKYFLAKYFLLASRQSDANWGEFSGLKLFQIIEKQLNENVERIVK